ncbi:MAG TPA: hypothetical protein VMZ29_07965 [Candidatus Bathyarchaeia archaeon]|nr:hypothetical protein [Candidatus Bathyarchaeia archaeon]
MKKNKNIWSEKLTQKAVEFTHPDIMAKMIATIDSNGDPHITMITSNKAVNPSTVKWGEFTYGTSKKNVLANSKQGILFMTAEMPFKFIQIKADFNYCSTEAEDAADFNQTDLFRYNVYMRVYKTYFNKVKEASSIRDIPLFGIVKGIIRNLFGKRKHRTGKIENRLPKFGTKLYNGLVFPKFIAYLDPKDGYPIIIPCFQARSIENKKIIFPLSQFKDDLLKIPENSKVAVFVMDFETETMLVKGTYLGITNSRGVIEIEQVYNSMPPQPGMIYPKLEVKEKVISFPKEINKKEK